MKLQDLVEKEKQKGTYAGVRYDTETKKALSKYIKDNKIPTAIRSDKIHTTLLYSRKYLPDYQPLGKLKKPIIAYPKNFVVWKAKNEKGEPTTNCLVLELDCPELIARHKKLMKEHGATYDFPVFKVHVTLSYDIGNLDYKKLPPVKDTIKQLKIIEEYGEILDLDWAAKKGVKKDK